MKYKVSRHPALRNDLAGLTFFIGEYAGYEVAERKIQEIEAAFRKLSVYPHLGMLRADVSPALRVLTAAGKAVIYFVTDDDHGEVRILGVSYAGADWQTRAIERL